MNVALLILIWALAVWGAALTGLLEHEAGDPFPRFLVPLLVPVVGGLVVSGNKTVRTILDHTPVSALVGVQTFRLAGVAFLLIVGLGILPPAFISSGIGDIVTGALAVLAGFALARRRPTARLLFWGFTATGLVDLLTVGYLLLAYYPGCQDVGLTSARAFEFSLVMIPALAAPMALLLHVFAFRNYLQRRLIDAPPAVRRGRSLTT